MHRKFQLHLQIQHGSFVLLLSALVILIGFIGFQYHYFQDVTQSRRNTVSENSLQTLSQMSGAISITVFASDDDAYRKNIKDFIARYQRNKPDIQLNFVNPATDPEQSQQVGARAQGELVINYLSRSEHLLPPYTEQELTNVLARLSRSQQQALVMLDGHGERNIFDTKPQEFSTWAQHLHQKGFDFIKTDLAKTPSLPKNTALLIIAGSKLNIAEFEVKIIEQYLNSGGNLLWLLEDEKLHGLDKIAEYIGLEIASGMVIDKSSTPFGGDAETVFGLRYGRHPITHNFSMRTLFTEARKVTAHGTYANGWKVQDLIHVAPYGWLETNPSELGANINRAAFNEHSDLPGPINIALTIERSYAKKGQRVVVVGNTNFLSNKLTTNKANLDLGTNIVNWLAGDNLLITIRPRLLRDVNLNIDADSNYRLIFIGLQILLPLGLLFFGLGTWWKRRKA